jgi:hypothetical protein
MKLAAVFQPAPATTNGQSTCAACTADPDDMPGCPRCGGTGTDPNL